MLVLLLDRPGTVVARDEIRQQLWPEDTFVEFDSGLKVAVKKIRDALDDAAEHPRFVETLPRRGYRFVAPVSVSIPAYAAIPSLPFAETAALPIPEPIPSAAPPPTRRRTVMWYVSLAGAAAISIALLTVAALSRASSSGSTEASGTSGSATTVRRSVAFMEFRNTTGHAQ